MEIISHVTDAKSTQLVPMDTYTIIGLALQADCTGMTMSNAVSLQVPHVAHALMLRQ